MSKTILIIEDNDLNLKLFRDLLNANGYETVETKEGLNALELAKRKMPDLILMDIQLPEISGLDVTRMIKADPDVCDIPVIAVTAFAMKDDEEKILRAGCEAYISKPISIASFLETVKQFLEQDA
jgi:two-component system cell cycle response regulator DivK